jgi:hypothetical protein
MTDPIILFVKSILRYWWALMSCAAFTFLGIWVTYANKSRGWVLWSSLILGIAFLFVAAYKAWANEHEGWAGERQRLTANIQKLQEELARKHPYDEDTEVAIRTAIAKLDDNEIRFLRWLLKNGSTVARADSRRRIWSGTGVSLKRDQYHLGRL